ncbi:hypothetical protein TNCV_2325551 [Trichonephila clavipes]|nr:hypothetical protein TNCV_2325551 [Trichonephila clavipes]
MEAYNMHRSITKAFTPVTPQNHLHESDRQKRCMVDLRCMEYTLTVSNSSEKSQRKRQEKRIEKLSRVSWHGREIRTLNPTSGCFLAITGQKANSMG